MILLRMTSFLLFNYKALSFISKSNILQRSFYKPTSILYSKKKVDSNIFSKSIQLKKPKTLNQIEYKSSLYNKFINLIFCMGPAGTGKTLFACQYAIESLKKEEIKKIIITRPMITIEEDMGYLPGNINQKMYPWTIPIFDIFEEYYTKKDLAALVEANSIEIAPLGFIQGRTFKNAIIIADEMQNSTPNQMFMLLTRIGENSKMIITGDLMQTTNNQNGLKDIVQKLEMKGLKDEDGIKIIKLSQIDIQRHKIVSFMTALYKGNL